MAASAKLDANRDATPFYRDARVLRVFGQALFVVSILLIGAYLYRNVRSGLDALGVRFGWDFLRQTAGFRISEGMPFDPTDSYARAFWVAAINTVRVAAVGIVLAMLLGLVIGISRLSSNWLLRTLATFYVEIIRNTPLLVQLFFWYFGVILLLPDVKAPLEIPGVGVISNRGAEVLWPFVSITGQPFFYWLLGSLIVGIGVMWWRRRMLRQQGKLGSGLPEGLLALVIVAAVGYAVSSATAVLPANIGYELRRGDRGVLFIDQNGNGVFDNRVDSPAAQVPVTLLAEDGKEIASIYTDGQGQFRFYDLPEGVKGASMTWEAPGPIHVSRPQRFGFNYQGGRTLSPEFVGLLLGLTIYTAAFISEIVRAGINAVPKGQVEASRALGLSAGQTLRMIVLPQALRVMIPPLTSQFLNLTKNSSLALAIGYPDLFSISQTILNQSGAALQIFILLMGVYLIFSLSTSAFTNWYNSRTALVER